MGVVTELILSLQTDAWWGAPLACAYLVLTGILPLPGFGPLVVASGFLFGYPKGFLLVYPSAVLGSCLGFCAGRRLPSTAGRPVLSATPERRVCPRVSADPECGSRASL